jgi:hypothetical protein
MKDTVGTLLLACIVGVVGVVQLCAQGGITKLPDEVIVRAGFVILVKQSGDDVTLRCDKGCTWKTLTISMKAKSTDVDDRGVADSSTSGRTDGFRIQFSYGNVQRYQDSGTPRSLLVACVRNCGGDSSFAPAPGGTWLTDVGVFGTASRKF